MERQSWIRQSWRPLEGVGACFSALRDIFEILFLGAVWTGAGQSPEALRAPPLLAAIFISMHVNSRVSLQILCVLDWSIQIQFW